MDLLTWFRAEWDRVVGGLLLIGGAAAVTAAALGARDAVFVQDQLAFLAAGGLPGAAIGIVGCVLVLSAGLHDEWRKLHRLDASHPSGEPDRVTLGRRLRAELPRALAWIAITAGLAAMLLSGHLVEEGLYPPDQLARLVSGSLGGLALVTSGAGILLLADLDDLRRRIGPIVAAADHRRRIVLAASAWVAGWLLVALGWWQARQALLFEPAFGGLLLAVIGIAAMILVAGGLALILRREIITQARATALALFARPAPPSVAVAAAAPDGTATWTAVGLTRRHRLACPALVTSGSEPVAGDPSLELCLICHDED